MVYVKCPRCLVVRKVTPRRHKRVQSRIREVIMDHARYAHPELMGAALSELGDEALRQWREIQGE